MSAKQNADWPPEWEADPWVYAYGSLLWNPGFDFVEAATAHLHGYHRSLCVYSWVHRGTEDCPGLVFGLDSGGACIGRAYRVAPAQAAEVRAYLDSRELVTAVYRPIHHEVKLDDDRRVLALCYVVDHTSDQYAGRLDQDALVRYIAQGVGRAGPCPEYVLNTIDHLDEMGIPDKPLHALGRRLRAEGLG